MRRVDLKPLTECQPASLYERKDAARFLCRCVKTITIWNRAGTLPARRIGHRFAILGQDILSLAGVDLTKLATERPETLKQREARGRAAIARAKRR